MRSSFAFPFRVIGTELCDIRRERGREHELGHRVRDLGDELCRPLDAERLAAARLRDCLSRHELVGQQDSTLGLRDDVEQRDERGVKIPTAACARRRASSAPSGGRLTSRRITLCAVCRSRARSGVPGRAASSGW